MRMKACNRAKAQCGDLIPILLSLILFSLPGLSQAACSANAEEWVQKSYIAYYGRPGDPAGIDYWGLPNGQRRRQTRKHHQRFGVSPEFTDRYGALSNSELLDSIYRQMFNRDPDEAGKAWYLAKLNARRNEPQTITLNVLGALPVPTKPSSTTNCSWPMISPTNWSQETPRIVTLPRQRGARNGR